jgi:hypothetical protein
MAESSESTFGDIPEQHHSAIQGFIDAAVADIKTQTETQINEFRSAYDKRSNTLEEENREHQRTIAKMTDESARGTEQAQTLVELEASFDKQDSARQFKILQDENKALKDAAASAELVSARDRAIVAGVPESLVSKATTKGELDYAAELHNLYGDKSGNNNLDSDGQTKGSASATATSTGSGGKGSVPDQTTTEGQLQASANELAKAGISFE